MATWVLLNRLQDILQGVVWDTPDQGGPPGHARDVGAQDAELRLGQESW